VIAWGNGSFEHPDKYEALLRHLASWGFIVVAAETDSAGTGREMLDGARFVIAADADPASPFFGHVDGAHVAAVGHSQGAGGSVRAATSPGGELITTVVPVALPIELFELLGFEHDFDPGRLRVPTFFMSGEADTIISSTGAVARFYGQARGPAAMGILRGADHNTVQLDGGGFRGYLTAWLRFQLAGDPVAAGAFVGPSPELLANPSWRDGRLKGLTTTGPSGPAAPVVAGLPTTTTVVASVASVASEAAAAPAGRLPTTGGAAPLPLLVPAALLAIAATARRNVVRSAACPRRCSTSPP
jgi:hypothetical protein